MFPTYPSFKLLELKDKQDYNYFYKQCEKPNSDYCFSVIFSWLALGGKVHAASLNHYVILIKYIDVLDANQTQLCYALIGSSKGVNKKVVSNIEKLVRTEPKSKVIVIDSLATKFRKLSSAKFRLSKDPSLCDYIYSVRDYSSLGKAAYRRIRRAKNVFYRRYNLELVLEEISPYDRILINTHHTWDKTFQYNNDPDRLEGLAIAKIIENAASLDLRCFVCKVNNKIEGILLFTISQASDGRIYADLHHARFSYTHKYINDCAFHLFAQELKKEKVQYINFERDAGVPGLRHHKKLLKPVKMINAYEFHAKF